MRLASTIRMLAAGALTALGIGAASAQDLEKITIQIDGAAVPYYLPMYVADHYGYFKEQGLEVEFLLCQRRRHPEQYSRGQCAVRLPKWRRRHCRQGERPAGQGGAHDLSKRHRRHDLQGVERHCYPSRSRGQKGRRHQLWQSQLHPVAGDDGAGGKSIDDVQAEIVGTGAILDALKSDQVDAIVFSMLRYYALQPRASRSACCAPTTTCPARAMFSSCRMSI